MGLLDNLFKPKPESGGEKSVENSAIPVSADSHVSGAASAVVPAQKASPFLAPKTYGPRSSMQIVPPSRNQLQVERKSTPLPEPPSVAKEIALTLGDVLSQIPTHFLRQGTVDLRRELRFPAEPIAADIARGRPAVSLAAIVAQCPEVFVPDASGFDSMQIRLPLQKLVEQIGPGQMGRVGIPPPPRAAVSEQATTPAPAPAAVPAPLPTSEEDPPRLPVSPPLGFAEEEQIHLNLAAILKRCPPDIIVQHLPPIDESVRVTFPFAPIERQLATGQVEVSSLRFIAALPLGLMKFFEARAGVRVPLPLEEIFQNLPNQAPPAQVQTRQRTPPPIEAPAVSNDPERENARLAEGILLEAGFESVAGSESVQIESAPASVEESIVTGAGFAFGPAGASRAETPIPELATRFADVGTPAHDTPVQDVSSDAGENAAVIELAAQLEALAAEDAKIEFQRHRETPTMDPQMPSANEPPSEVPAAIQPVTRTPFEDQSPSDTPAGAHAESLPANATPYGVPATNLPEPQPPETGGKPSVAAVLPERDAPAVNAAAFRPFVPVLRPVILQPKAGAEIFRPSPASPAPSPPLQPEPESEPAPISHSMPAPVATTPEVPKPPQAFQPPQDATPALTSAPSVPAPTPPPPSVLQRPPRPAPAVPAFAPPVPQPSVPVTPPAPPVTENPLIAATESASSPVRVGPPQFRPFVVQPPPIVLAPLDSGTTVSHPSVGASAHARPEPESEIARTIPHPQSAPVAARADVPQVVASAPPAINEVAPPFALDGRVREFFASDAPLALPRVSQLLAALPGIQGCLLVAHSAEYSSGDLPAGLNSSAIIDLSQRMRAALPNGAGTFSADHVQHLTLHAEDYSLSFFTRGAACVCAVHRARIFLPGVRERFAAVADELARSVE